MAGIGRDRSRPRVNSGGRQDWHGGPAVKINRLQEVFPNEPYAFNIIYSVSGHIDPEVCRWAQRRGVKIVAHVNSMYHPLYAPDFDTRNRSIRDVHALADHVVYGSRLAQQKAAQLLGETSAPCTILHNAVDTNLFRPSREAPADRFHILAAGVHRATHRLEPLIRAMPLIHRTHPQARLLIAGSLVPGEGIFDCRPSLIEELIRNSGARNVKIVGEYTQADAPGLYARGDVLVHIRHLDWTPNTVIEAMACGLPIVHSGTGGLPELVGEAGVSLGLPDDWNRVQTADPERLSEKIVEAFRRRKELGETARKRALEMFDIQTWADTHRRIFEGLLGSK